MSRPGVEVVLSEQPGQVSIEADTGVWFASGLTDRGPTTPYSVRSLNQFVTVFGDRQTYSPFYDAIEEYFAEGGSVVVVTRVVGPAASVGTLNLLDGSAAISLVATANGPGAWSNQYKLQVVAGTVGGTYAIHVLDATNNILEDSGNLVTQNDAIAWAYNSQYIRLALGVSTNVPAVMAATALSAGNDDRANITDTQWNSVLSQLSSDYGPGQVSQPGRTSSTAYGQLITHCEANNRVALLDLPDTNNATTLENAISTLNSRFAAAFAPWPVVPGLVVATTRKVPPCAMVAGLIAKNDPIYGPNKAAAGVTGISRYAVDVSQPGWTDDIRAQLNVAGVNVIRNMRGTVRVYGWRSLADPVNDQTWLDFGNARLFTGLTTELNAVGESFMFAEIDGQNGKTIGAFNAALVGACLRHYNSGELFGATPQDAFVVDTGPAVNTIETIKNLELHAIVSVKMAPFAEYIQIIVNKQPIA